MKSLKPNDVVGIIGGMGPMSDILLQQLIIEATPAHKDQDHIRVICFTDPKIPDRTTSLSKDNGSSMARAIIEAGQSLRRAGASVLVIACNTAHARFQQIQKGISVPLVSLIELTKREITARHGKGASIGLLATDGTLREKIFSGEPDIIDWKYPSALAQQRLMKTIYDIKAHSITMSSAALEVEAIVTDLRKQGAVGFVLGCSELSLLNDQIKTKSGLIDPLRITANEIVSWFYPKLTRRASFDARTS